MTTDRPHRYPLQDLALLCALALVARVIAAALVPPAPYTDAAYYTLVAQRLASGDGFSAPVLWSFLEVGGRLPADPVLPVPSNGHWMPLTSIIAAGGMLLFGEGWRGGQVPMIGLSVAWVAMTHATAWELWHRRRTAVVGALLAVFAGPLFIFMPLVDGFVVFGTLGSAALYAALQVVRSSRPGPWLVASGALVGLSVLTRVDGLLLAVAPAVGWWMRRRSAQSARASVTWVLASAATCVLVLLPWLIRNVVAFGTPLPSAGGHTLWITSYNEQFSIGHEVSIGTYLASGPIAILTSKAAALGELAGRSLGLLGGPFAIAFVAGVWIHRRHRSLTPLLAYLTVWFAAMVLVFTFHAPKGAFLHSAPAWLPFAYAIAAGSLATAATRAGRWWAFLARPQTHRFLEMASLMAAVVISLAGSLALLADWRISDDRLTAAAGFLAREANPGDVVMSDDPARVYLATRLAGVAAPFDPYRIIEKVVDAYDVRWVVVTLDGAASRDPLGLWDGPGARDIEGAAPPFLLEPAVFEAPGVRIFRVTPESGGPG